MSVWDAYVERTSHAGVLREALVEQAKNSISQMILDSPSSHTVQVNGTEQRVLITHRKAANEKNISSMPGELLAHGGIVDFANCKWLITELDADSEIYSRGIMLRCNYLLKWIGKDGTIKEKWCIVEDGTRYLIGELSREMMSIGDARIALTIGKDSDTNELKRGMRFIIDDSDSDMPSVYQITKPNKLFNAYGGVGVFRFILTESQLTKDDNVELRIADYTSWRPVVNKDGDHVDSDLTVGQVVDTAYAEAQIIPDDTKEGWI